jgi:predicted DNA-binding transcriptional regulator AlpA
VFYVSTLAPHAGVSRFTVWRWVREGKLPPMDAHIGGEAVGWLASTIARVLSGEWKPKTPPKPSSRPSNAARGRAAIAARRARAATDARRRGRQSSRDEGEGAAVAMTAHAAQREGT